MTPQITAVFASILGLMMIFLSGRVSAMRQKVDITIGDGGNETLLKAIRCHANFIEVVPMALILMALAEMLGAGSTWLMVTGAILVVARIIHPIGMTSGNPKSIPRGLGSMGTFVVVLLSVVAILRITLGF